MTHKQYLYHITSQQEWNIACSQGEYLSQNFTAEQFIHCSYGHKILTVANRFYKGQNGLVLLKIKSSTINSSLVEENLEGGTELYPHLYSSLPINSVVQAVAFPCNADGNFTLPQELNM